MTEYGESTCEIDFGSHALTCSHHCSAQEFVAPLVHIGWMLCKSNQDNHWLWDVNQRALIVLWVITRNVLDVALWGLVLWKWTRCVRKSNSTLESHSQIHSQIPRMQ